MGQNPIQNRRIQLHQLLTDILGSNNVYFQPPESIKMKYPCIVYSLADIDSRFADNIPYLHKRRYSVTVIDRDPDSSIRDKMTYLKNCSYERGFTADNLYHYIFNITY